MTKFHAVMLDETRCEFGADVEADTREEAYVKLGELYSESRVVQLESPSDTAEREKAMYDHISRGGDWDDDGAPIGGDWEDEYEEEDEEDDDGLVDGEYVSEDLEEPEESP